MNLPKPKSCHQNWLEMPATSNGRMCLECKKNIIDFTKKNWSEIEYIQEQSGLTTCGMYTKKQLDHWGHQPPSLVPSKALATTALLVGMSLSSFAQDTTASENVIIEGVVTGKNAKDEVEPIPFSTVTIKETKSGVVTDIDGKFRLDVTELIDSLPQLTVSFICIGYVSQSIVFPQDISGTKQLDVSLLRADISSVYFAVPEPGRWRKIKWRIQAWFRKNKEE